MDAYKRSYYRVRLEKRPSAIIAMNTKNKNSTTHSNRNDPLNDIEK